MFQKTIDFVRTIYGQEGFIPLHEPAFLGKEKEYLLDCIDSTFVSSVGKYVDRFEEMIARFTGAKHAIATVNGTSALHIALKLSNVERGDEVITQPLTFVATCNALSYIGSHPIFIDVDRDSLSLSPDKLEHFLKHNTKQVNGRCLNKSTNRIIKAVIPMHTFGIPARLQELKDVCESYNLVLIEDAAESLGSYYKDAHTGTIGLMGVLSFNGNKTITTGGGGMLITNDSVLAKKAKHITTTAKIPHKWEFVHDEIGFNYRMPNINAALGCAQMEELPKILSIKRDVADRYKMFFEDESFEFVGEPSYGKSNYWLNAVILDNFAERNHFLETSNAQGVMTRPIWRLMNKLKMFKNFQKGNLENSLWLEERVVNIPSSVK